MPTYLLSCLTTHFRYLFRLREGRCYPNAQVLIIIPFSSATPVTESSGSESLVVSKLLDTWHIKSDTE